MSLYGYPPHDPAFPSRDMLSGTLFTNTSTQATGGFNGYFCHYTYNVYNGEVTSEGDNSYLPGEIGEAFNKLVYADRAAAMAAFIDRTGLTPVQVYQRHSGRTATFDYQNTHSTFALQLQMYRQAMNGAMATLLLKNLLGPSTPLTRAMVNPWHTSVTPIQGGGSNSSSLGFAHNLFASPPTFEKSWYAAHDIAMQLSAWLAVPTLFRAQIAWDHIKRGYGVLGDLDGLYFLYEVP